MCWKIRLRAWCNGCTRHYGGRSRSSILLARFICSRSNRDAATMTPILDYNKIAKLPALVRSFCFNNEGWIVGSGALYLLSLKSDEPRDYDILVPFYQWGLACRSIPENSPTNSHGGVKVRSDGLSIDVWCGDIGWFLGQVPQTPAYAVNPKTMTFLTVSREMKRVKS